MYGPITPQAVVLNGVYSGVPYAMMAGVALSAGAVADCLRKRVSTTVVRKAFTTACKRRRKCCTNALSEEANMHVRGGGCDTNALREEANMH